MEKLLSEVVRYELFVMLFVLGIGGSLTIGFQISMFNYSAMKLWDEGECQAEADNLQNQKAAMGNVKILSVLEVMEDQNVRWQLCISIIVIITLQFSGINVTFTVEQFGRKTLLWKGYAFMALATTVLTVIISPQENLASFCFLIFTGILISSGIFIYLFPPEIKENLVMEITEEFGTLHFRKRPHSFTGNISLEEYIVTYTSF